MHDVPAAPPSLPPEWGELTAPDGRIYYFNLQTNSTTWERPAQALGAQVVIANNTTIVVPPPVVISNNITMRTGMSGYGHDAPINLSGKYDICDQCGEWEARKQRQNLMQPDRKQVALHLEERPMQWGWFWNSEREHSA